MTDKQHPLRTKELRTYVSHIWGAVSFFGSGKEFPIYFRGDTLEESESKAEAFRRETLDKYEKAYLARRKAAVEAAERRKKKVKK